MNRRRALLVLATVAVTACGRKSSPLPPELVRPSAPAEIVATAVEDGVQLKWARPRSYTSGRRMRDLATFEIERAIDQGGGLAYAPVATLVLEDRLRFQQAGRLEWKDAEVREGVTYFYRVTAVTVDGDRSEPSGAISILYRKPTRPTPAAH